MQEKEFLIDIASKSQYQNQSAQYHEAYTKWRMNENNRFGYKFTKDTREHAYAFGEGFEHNNASDAERKTLHDCSSLFGGGLLIASLIRLLQAFFDSRTGHMLSGASLNLTGSVRNSDILAAIVLMLFYPVSVIICFFICQFFIKLPKAVLLPTNKRIPKHIPLLLFGVMSGIAVVCYMAAVFMRYVIGTKYLFLPSGIVITDLKWLNLFYFFLQYIISPILQALLLNGLIMQTLRQFGDSTAIFFTTIIEAILALNLTNIGTHLVIALIICLMTIKTGSIFTAVFARITVNLIFFLLSFVESLYNGQDGELYMLLICITIMGIALFCLGKLLSYDHFDFSIINVKTELQFTQKLGVFFTSMPMIEWFAASAVAWLYIVVA